MTVMIGLNDSYDHGQRGRIIDLTEYLTLANFKNCRKNFKKGTQSECWLWDGSLNSEGYAVVIVKGADGHRRKVLAHRFIFSYIHGPIKTNTLALHNCGGPKNCVNPFHIELGSFHKNSAMMLADGNEARPNAKLQDSQVLEILEKSHAAVMTQVQLARQFHVSPREISNIVNGKVFRHITGPFLDERGLPS